MTKLNAKLNLSAMFEAFVVLNADGDYSKPTSAKATEYLARQEFQLSNVSKDELLQITSQLSMVKDKTEYLKWQAQYLNALPQNPFEALIHDTYLVNVFIQQNEEHNKSTARKNNVPREQGWFLLAVFRNFKITALWRFFRRSMAIGGPMSFSLNPSNNKMF